MNYLFFRKKKLRNKMSQSGLAGMGVALGLTALIVNFSIHKIEEG